MSLLFHYRLTLSHNVDDADLLTHSALGNILGRTESLRVATKRESLESYVGGTMTLMLSASIRWRRSSEFLSDQSTLFPRDRLYALFSQSTTRQDARHGSNGVMVVTQTHQTHDPENTRVIDLERAESWEQHERDKKSFVPTM